MPHNPDDLQLSLRRAIQLISWCHPSDFVRALHNAWIAEESPAAKGALSQILTNSRMSMLGRRPICQDTGVVNVFLKIGTSVEWTTPPDLTALVNQAVADAYLDQDNPLRASMIVDPLGARQNSGNNTPAMIHTELVTGDQIEVHVAAKGGGSENKTQFAVLLPGANITDWVVDKVSKMGAGWCPPGVLGIGVGGSVEHAMLMAKRSLLGPVDMPELRTKGPQTRIEELRIEIADKVNNLGIGAQGLGGITTVLDVKIETAPTHAASLPIALIPNCAANRHIGFTLTGDGPATFDPPKTSDWPEVITAKTDANIRHVDLNTLTKEQISKWKIGDQLLLRGKMLTGRDAAHRRICQMLDKGEELPVSLKGRVIYYVGPVDAVRDEIVGPAGPTTATRMDPYTEQMLDQTGLVAMIGKAERGPVAIEAIKKHKAASLIATGGAAFLISQSIKSSRVLAFDDLGMEAIHEFDVLDFPVTVAVDAKGNSVHLEGIKDWARTPILLP